MTRDPSDRPAPPAAPEPDPVEDLQARLGVQWLELDDEEAFEEEEAVAENETQALLVSFLGGHLELTDLILDAYRVEMQAEAPNDALLLPHFRAGNPRLKILLLESLARRPQDTDRLADLVFLHGFSPMTAELTAAFRRAGELARTPGQLAGLIDAFEAAIPERLSALLADLAEVFQSAPAMRSVIAARSGTAAQATLKTSENGADRQGRSGCPPGLEE